MVPLWKKKFNPLSFFAAGEQGILVPSMNMAWLYQDYLFTTPVTAVEQPVGGILDQSGRGNNLTQSTAAKRPTYSARYNLLIYSEVFNVNWNNNALITPNSALSPIGTLTADTLTSNGTQGSVYTSVAGVTASVQYRLSVSVKYTNNQWIYLQLSDLGVTHRASAWFDIQNGVKGTSAVTGSGVVVDYTITAEGNGWYRCELIATNPITTLYPFISSLVTGDGSLTVAASGKSSLIWGADLRPANDGVGIPSYQRVTTATDYATDGFPAYILFDGVDDALATGNINFTSTNKMLVLAAARRFTDNALIIAELSTDSGAVINSWGFYQGSSAPANSGQNWGAIRYSAGTSSAGGTTSPLFAAPLSNVVRITFDGAISGMDASTSIHVNGSAKLPAAYSNSAMNTITGFSNNPLYLGSRASTSLYFSGRIYSLIVRGAQTSAAQLAQAETYLNQRAKIY